MNTKTKLALGLTGILAVAIWRSARRKGKNKKVFTAPDGFSYKENQVYRTVDNKFYKNGKQMHYNTPPAEITNSSVFNHHNDSENNIENKQYSNKEVTYHSKGVRHH